jgi:hypothetical protein
MDSFNLSSDESVIFKTQRLILGGVLHEATFTSRRLILVKIETGRVQEEIPFTDIELAVAGINTLREPVISLTINPPKGDTRAIDLIFIHTFGNQNLEERNKCIRILKEQNVTVNAEGFTDVADTGSSVISAKTGVLATDQSASRPASPEWLLIGSSGNNKRPLPEEPPERSPLITVVAIFIIIVVIICGMTLMGQMLKANTQPAPQDITPPAVTPEVTISSELSPTQTPESQVTTVPAGSSSPISIPATGVWVRIHYLKSFSGYIGSHGRNIQVSGSGTKWYQLPVTDPTVDGSITKLDGSADKLEVETYKDGTRISRWSTTTPHGVIDLLVTAPEKIIDEVVTGVVATAPAPTPESQAIEDYLPRISVPTSGVWVRIYYPGSFSGSVGGRGIYTQVKSAGDQLYEMPVNVGIVEGSIEKDDGSVGKMVVEVYKDGVVTSRMVTTTPAGLIDLHVPV